MTVFVSWSGELSKTIAEQLKKWIPCIIQSIDVFFSPDDIEKGENWDSKISQVLSDCSYGIICLTPENVSAPWINFEAGAIAKSLDARVSCLMLNIRPSDIKGPLARYQATNVDRKEIFQLISAINKATNCPLEEGRLTNAFMAMWPQFEQDLKNTLKKSTSVTPSKIKNDPIEEVLQLLRKISSTVSSPSDLLPPEYFIYLQERQFDKNKEYAVIQGAFFDDIICWLDRIFDEIVACGFTPQTSEILQVIRFREIFDIAQHYIGRNRVNKPNSSLMKLRRLKDKYNDIFHGEFPTISIPHSMHE